VFHLEAFGAGLFEQRSVVTQCPHLLLTSWLPSAHQLAGALVALGTLAQLRNKPASSPSPVHLPGLFERCVPPQDGEAVRSDVTWSRRLGNVNPLVTSVVGASDYVDSVLAGSWRCPQTNSSFRVCTTRFLPAPLRPHPATPSPTLELPWTMTPSLPVSPL